MLAVADEDGYVSCLNTDKPLPDNLDADGAARNVNAQWQAHDNAIFDLCWMQVRGCCTYAHCLPYRLLLLTQATQTCPWL